MQVFNAYFQIIRKHIATIMIYLIVFVVLTSIIAAAISSQTPAASFSETKYDIALFNEDTDAALAQGLAQYLGETAHIVDIQKGDQDIQDALFYGQVDCVVTIPAGFSKGFMNGEDAQVSNTSAAGQPASVYMDFEVNRYLNAASLYAKNMPGASEGDIAEYVAEDLGKTTVVDYRQGAAADPQSNIGYYFRFLAYSMLAAIMMGVSMAMMSLGDSNINNRTLCSPLKPARMNLQLVLANGVFALVVWVALCAFTLAYNSTAKLDAGILLLCLNALVFALVCLCIGLLVSKFIHNHGVQAAVTNVVSLGVSFISGVFVEQDLLGKTVQTIGSFTPTYWYIRVVDTIQNASAYTAQNLKPAIEGMLIQLGFAAAILIVLLAVSKQRRKTAV
jgi:ABC-2 type transport system permease protein